MARRRYIYVEGRGLVEVPDLPPRPRVAIQGVREPFRSMADGLWYDDRRTYERAVRAQGYEVVGNERDPKHWGKRPEPPSAVEDIVRTANELGMEI